MRFSTANRTPGGASAAGRGEADGFVSGRSHDRQRAGFMSATGQLRGRLRAVSRVRCQVCALVGIQRRVVEAGKGPQELALLISTPFGPVPYNQVLRLTSGWDAAVLGGLLSVVLPDATVLPAVMIAGLFYVGWVNASTVWTHQRRVKPTPQRAEQLRN